MNEQEQLKKVEYLHEKAGVSMADAKEALEQNNWNLLDAMVFLEKTRQAGQEEKPEFSSEFSTKEAEPKIKTETKKEDIASFFENVIKTLGSWIEKGNHTHLRISKDNKQLLTLPITILVIILLLITPGIPFVILAAIVAYFFGVRFAIVKDEDLGDSHNKQDQ